MRAKHTLYQLSYTPLKCLNFKKFVIYFEARLVELVDTSDLKSDSNEEYRFKSDNEYTHIIAKMMELVDMLGLGSSS
jgi:hypothetical protein